MNRFLLVQKLFVALLFLFSINSLAQQGGVGENYTCENAAPVCPDNNFGVNIPNVLNVPNAEVGPEYACLGSEPRPMWFYMRVATSGYGMFDLTQYELPDGQGQGLDVDFILWGPFESQNVCNELTLDKVVDCSYDGRSYEVIDFYTENPNWNSGPDGPFNPGWVNEGEYYILLVTNYDSSGRAGYVNLLPRYSDDPNEPQMTATFDCSILGPVYEFCDVGGDGVETVDLAEYELEIGEGNQFVAVTFHPTSTDAYNYTNPLENNQTITLGETLTVYARKENLITGQVEVIILTFGLIPEPELQEDTLTICDNNGDGLELFDLTTADVIVAETSEIGLTYYLTEEDAEAAENPIENPEYFESGTADIYVRGDAGNCFATNVIHLELIDTLQLTPVTDDICDTDGTGTVVVDLTTYTDEITGGNAGTIRFYENESDAIAGNENNISNPETYETQSTVLYVLLSNDGACNGIATLTLNIYNTPQLAEAGPYAYCDNLADGTETIDLTVAQADLVSSTEGLTFTYYANENDAQENNTANAIADPATYVLNATTVIYVLVANEHCSAYQAVTFELLAGVVVENVTLRVCADGTGSAVYDLTSAAVATTFDSITYYPTLEDAQNQTNAIVNPSEYTSTYPATFYAVVSSGECSNIAEIYLDVFADIVLNAYETTVCDTDGNGVETFNLNDFNDEIYPDGGTVTYYEDEADAQAGNANSVQNPEEYTTGTVTLFAYVGSGDCSAYTTLTINVIDSPQANDVETPYTYCDDFNDGVETIDITVAFADVVSSTGGLQAEYYLSEADALAGNSANAISNPTAFELTGTTTIYIRVFAAGCADVATAVFELTDGIAVTNATLYACNNDSGSGTFDLTSANVGTAETYTYHPTLQDAIDGTNAIGNAQSYTSNVPGVVYVRLEAGECLNTAEIDLEFYSVPEINIPGEFAICSGTSASVDAGAGFAGYLWSTGETSQVIEIDELGNYWVTVTDANGCSFTHEFSVVSGIAPIITNVDEGPDYLVVTAEGGVAPYQYSINGFLFQDSNQFNNLTPGTYNVFVRGEDGCISTVEVVSIFEWPTMFTPNGDGINDTWRIPGLEVYPGSHIQIYDRYGALIYESAVDSNVLWDGKDMNGNKVSTQDYWYILDVSDGRKFTGHVTVKNRTEKGR